MKRGAILLVVTLAGAGLLSAPAQATKLGYRDLHVKVRTSTVNIPTGATAHAIAGCPNHTHVLSGGAFLHRTDQGPDPALADNARVSSSVKLNDGFWFANAWNIDGPADLQLTTTVTCTSAKHLSAGGTRLTGQLGPGQVYADTLQCTDGEIVSVGGAIDELLSSTPSDALADEALIASLAPTNATTAIFSARNTSPSNVGYEIEIVCSKKLKALAPIVASTGAINGAPVGAYVPCPDRTRILNGGVFLHQPDAPPAASESDRARLSSSAPTNDKLAWYGDGYAVEIGGDQFETTITANCLPL